VQRWLFLGILFFVATTSYFDRLVISVLLEPIKNEFHASDTTLGLLSGFSFAVFYALFGVPMARWADRGNRRTIITLALIVWSIMTVLCGLAQTLVQLALARIGVGAGESGTVPPAQSLIADYFPPERRAMAISIFMAASTLGNLLGIGVGGYLATRYGWRAAFLVAGAPGLVLVLVTCLGLGEPRLQLGFPAERNMQESFGQALRLLMAKRGFVYALTGCILYFFVSYGAFAFVPSFLIRALHVSLVAVSLGYGSVFAASSVVGAVTGGWMADRLARRDRRWLAWIPAAACTLAGPTFAAALCCSSYLSFLGFVFVSFTLLVGGLPPIYTAILATCGSQRRATAISIVLFSATLVGGGLGPIAAGGLSDAFTLSYGADGLRYSLIMISSVLFAVGFVFFLSGRAMPLDLETGEIHGRPSEECGDEAGQSA
jgi:MFS family permease